MDYIPFPNLSEYVKQNKSTLSTHTKIHLMFMLVQALRVIKENDVVHADVKPSNVLLYCGLFIKLIDFGESYHPQVCNKSIILLT
jgi:serine/threonine protein kinase